MKNYKLEFLANKYIAFKGIIAENFYNNFGNKIIIIKTENIYDIIFL